MFPLLKLYLPLVGTSMLPTYTRVYHCLCLSVAVCWNTPSPLRSFYTSSFVPLLCSSISEFWHNMMIAFRISIYAPSTSESTIEFGNRHAFRVSLTCINPPPIHRSTKRQLLLQFLPVDFLVWVCSFLSTAIIFPLLFCSTNLHCLEEKHTFDPFVLYHLFNIHQTLNRLKERLILPSLFVLIHLIPTPFMTSRYHISISISNSP